MAYNQEFKNLSLAAGLSLEDAATLFGLKVPTTALYNYGYILTPEPMRYALHALAAGWKSQAPWEKNPLWLRDTLRLLEQSPQAFANVMHMHFVTAQRYILNGNGPKRYVMVGAEAWLLGPGGPPKPTLEVPRRSPGRPRLDPVHVAPPLPPGVRRGTFEEVAANPDAYDEYMMPKNG